MWRLAGLALVVVGANSMDPYLTPVRSLAPYAIAAAGATGLLVICLRGERRRGLAGALFALLWAAVPLSVLGAKVVFELRKQSVLAAGAAAAPGDGRPSLGRHFMVGYTSIDEVGTLAARGLIGGVYVTGRNVRGRSAEDLREDLFRLQRARRTAGLPPLAVAVDQEGGVVSHLSPPLTPAPALADLASAAPDRRVVVAHNQGAIHGLQLASLGVTINLAPVLDLRRSHPYNPLDFNSSIQLRAISDDPAVVGEIGLAYSRGLAEQGVTPTVKHFPGLGRLSTDTHHFRASIDASVEDLEATDWAPFRRVLSGSSAMMMVGHVTLSAIDPERPASHSRKVIDGVLRRGWGYQGVLVTDDLNMSPIYHHGLCDAVVEGLNAGIDLLLVAFDGQQYYRVMRCAMDAREAGILDEAMLEASEKRLQAMERRSALTMHASMNGPTQDLPLHDSRRRAR
jgi:beta-N-acetylhexosaminidase